MTGAVNPTALNFTPPKYPDGTAIGQNLAKYQYGFGTTSRTYTKIVDDMDLSVDAAGKQAGVIPTDLSDGQWFAAARAVTKGGIAAAWGNEVPFSVDRRAPAAITDLSLA